MNLLPFDQGLGDIASNVSLFTFRWDGIDTDFYSEFWNPFFDLAAARRNAHLQFNQAFVARFPKLLYTVPFTNYTQPVTAIVGSRLTGTAETVNSESEVRQAVIQMALAAGFTSYDESLLQTSLVTIQQLQQGQRLDPGVIDQGNSNINPLATTDGSNAAIDKLLTDLKWPAVVAGVVLMFVLLKD